MEAKLETPAPPKIIRKKELLHMLGVTDPTLYRWEQAGKFPARLQLGGNSVGWLTEEVDVWLATKKSDAKVKAEARV